ncbi:MAG: hypothetical protein U5K76_12960 [Woeseiaceae bacterium]|nr:hypothetical protein [Woeseiaceae bacterium]
MITILKRLALLALGGSAMLVGGCAGSMGSAYEPPTCMASETMICYGKSASKLDTRSNDFEFCRCESVIDSL